ncbi:AAA family ATPase [Streptomyces sp. NBC_00433]
MAAARVRELAEALESVGYSCTTSFETPSGEVGRRVEDFLVRRHPDDVCVVHLVGHGTSEPRSESASGPADPDGRGGEGWLRRIQRRPDAPATLFFLDACQAGDRLPDRPRIPDTSPRTWLIATDGRDHPQIDGALSRAAAAVLRRLRAGDLGIDPSMASVPLPTVAREIRRQIAGAGSSPASIWTSAHDPSFELDDPPFFPNPAYAGGQSRGRLRPTLDPAVLPFLEGADEGFDPSHFMERASGSSAVAEYGHGVVGQFAGRDRELRALTAWLDHGDADESLAVVTGSPGAGKSALLGLLVCAAHPRLREASRELWSRAANAPREAVRGFAAVHARQRDLSEICGSIAHQLDLPARSPAELVDALRHLVGPPVIVIDALDEMVQGVDVMEELLLPLAQQRRPGGGPAARVLVATRNYAEFRPLLDEALRRGLLIDLDAVPPSVLAADLRSYVTGILRTVREYRSRGSVVAAFADELAAALTGPGSRGWGGFLVAGLCTRYFIVSHAGMPVMDWEEAAEAARQAPRDPIGVLELDLRSQPGRFWLRPVLTALGSARGLGMPASVLTRIAHLFIENGDAGPVASEQEIRDTLTAGRFYLRTVTDSDGTTLYRLFHQSIGDHLLGGFTRSTGHHTWRRDLLDPLLAPLGPREARDWSLAEPYLLRHGAALAVAAERAQEVLDDPEFLLRADPPAVHDVLRDGHLTAPFPAPLLASLLDRRPALEHRRFAASLTAVRTGLSELAHRLATPRHEPSLPWQPWWTARGPVSPGRIIALPAGNRSALLVLSDDGDRHAVLNGSTGEREERLSPHPGVFVAARRYDLAGRTVALLEDSNGTRSIWDPQAPRLIDAGHWFAEAFPRFAPDGVISAEGTLHGRLVVALGTPEGTLIIEDVINRHLVADERRAHNGRVTAVSTRQSANDLMVFTGGTDGTVRLWYPGRGDSKEILLLDRPIRVLDVSAEGELFVGIDDEILAFRGDLAFADHLIRSGRSR